MIIFDYTQDYKYTCRDCEKNFYCVFSRHGKEPNRLTCLDAKVIHKNPVLINADWDFNQLKQQLVIMRCVIESRLHKFMRDDFFPVRLISGGSS